MALPNTIIVTGVAGRRHEDIAGEDNILAGHFVVPNGTAIDNGCRATVVTVPTAGMDVETRIVLEDSLAGKGTDSEYDTGATMQTYTPVAGEIGLARLTHSVSYDEGDQLIFADDGSLKKTTGSPLKTVAVIREAIDLSAIVVNSLGKVTFA